MIRLTGEALDEIDQFAYKLAEHLGGSSLPTVRRVARDFVARWTGKGHKNSLFHGECVQETFDPEDRLAYDAYFPESVDEDNDSRVLASLASILLRLPAFAEQPATRSQNLMETKALMGACLDYLDARRKKIGPKAMKLWKRADTRSDISKPIGPPPADVKKLLRERSRAGNGNKSMIALALELADGNRKRADALLRKVRRYR